MPLSSSSTDAEVLAEYEDNVGFESTGSLAQAQAVVTACRILLVRTPKSTTVDGISVTWDLGVIREELERARRFVAARRSGGSARYFDLRNSRD